MESLNDKIWSGKSLLPEIKEKLMIISRKIIADLEIDVDVKYVLFTGSLASFVWRSSSDIDLHIIVDPITKEKKIAADYLDTYCKIFNSYHAIFIRGYKLEINIKLEEKFLDDKGIYDILTDRWLQTPSIPSKILSNDEEIKNLTLSYQEKIDDLLNKPSTLDDVDSLRKELKSLRTTGLAEEGEYSKGNLVFKELRHSGYLEKLYNLAREKEDEFLSFESFAGFFNRLM